MIKPIMLQDLDFDEIRVEFRAKCGSPYFRKLKVGMPRISQEIIDSVFYLYPTEKDAEAGTNPGGTGFVVCMENHDGDLHHQHYYGVTNWHVAVRDGLSVVRINRLDGTPSIFGFSPEDWEFIARGPDVAVIPLELDHRIHRCSSVSTRLFAADYDLKSMSVGEDVFMIGLFVDHAGVTTNSPKARFGNISMLASEDSKIKQPTLYEGRTHIIDAHSRSGFSGSPVFVYRTPLSDFGSFQHLRGTVDATSIARQLNSPAARTREIDVALRLPNTLFALLGIHWGQFPEEWQIRNPDKISESDRRSLINNGGYISGVSGMTCVIPSSEILDVLELPKLVELRKQKESLTRHHLLLEPRAEKYKSE